MLGVDALKSVVGVVVLPALLLLVDQGVDVLDDSLESDEGAVATVLLLDHVGVLEVAFQLCGPLDAPVADLADLDGVELLPPQAVELEVEVADELRADEVHEGVADVAVVLSPRKRTLQSIGRQKKSNFLRCPPSIRRSNISCVYLLGMFRTITVVRPSASTLSTSTTQLLDSSQLMARRFLPDCLAQQQLQSSIWEGKGKQVADSDASVIERGVYWAETGLELYSVSSVMTRTQDLTTALTSWSSSSLLGDSLRSFYFCVESSRFSYSRSRMELLKARWLQGSIFPRFRLGTRRCENGLPCSSFFVGRVSGGRVASLEWLAVGGRFLWVVVVGVDMKQSSWWQSKVTIFLLGLRGTRSWEWSLPWEEELRFFMVYAILMVTPHAI